MEWEAPITSPPDADCYWGFEGEGSDDPDCGGAGLNRNWASCNCIKDADPGTDSYMYLQIHATFPNGDTANYKSDDPVCSSEECLSPIAMSLTSTANQSRCPIGSWPSSCTLTPV